MGLGVVIFRINCGFYKSISGWCGRIVFVASATSSSRSDTSNQKMRSRGYICNKIRPFVGTKRKNKKARSSSGSGVPTELCLSMTLRYLASGAFVNIIDMHGVGSNTFYRVVWATVEAINKVIPMDGFPHKDLDRL